MKKDKTEEIKDIREEIPENDMKDTVVMEADVVEIDAPSEGSVSPAAKKAAEEARAAEEAPVFEPADKPAAKAKKNYFKELFGDKPVTRKFLAAMLGITLLLNAGISAGLMAIFSHNNSKNTPQFDNNGRPGSEQNIGDQNGRDGMAPPSNGQGGPGSSEQGAQGSNGSAQNSQSKASIGITIRDDQGVYIADVTGDNAKSAGFQAGDKIVSIDGTSVSSSNDLVSALQNYSAGDTVTITVERDGQQMEISTTLE